MLPYGFGLVPVTDDIPLSNVYPTAPGLTLGVNSTLGGAGMNLDTPSTDNSAASAPAAVVPGGQKSFLVAGFVVAALLFLLMFTAKKVGQASEFSSIKASVYNVAVIGLAAVLIIPILKYIVTKFPVPGITPWVLAS